MNKELAQKNRRIGMMVAAVVTVMVTLAYASVPLYNLFCRVTGFGGTTQVANAAPPEILDRTISVRFNADTGRGMPWTFKPGQREISIKLGEKKLVTYEAGNPAARPVSGTAIYNVVPAKAGKYFKKIECFCFAEQTLKPGEKASMPVAFFIDPALNDDPNMKDLQSITLSYTFFEIGSTDLDTALEDFYNQDQY